MDVVTKQREVFFNNLLILGFDKASIEKEYRITCDKNMFCVPNRKMFEVVTCFLFSKLNQVSNSKYSVPWPLMDEDQHRQFQKACFNHLSNIAQDSNIKFPRIVSSLLSSFGGDRFYELFLAFSNHVVQRTIIKKNNVSLIMMPTVSHQNSQDVIDTLKMATILSVENFQEVQKSSLKHFKLLFTFAKQYTAQIHHLKLSLTTNCSLLKESINTLKKLYNNQSEESSLKAIAKESWKYQKKVNDLWLLFEKFLIKESKLWSYLCSEVDGNHEKYSLNGADFNYNISDNMKKCFPTLTEVDRIRTSENEKLDLFRYLETFHTLLEYYKKITIKGELFQVNELCLNKNTSRLEESLKQIQSLNENLVTTILPSIKDSTQKLEDNMKEFSEDLEIIVKECPSWSCCSKIFLESVCSFRSQKDSTMPYNADVFKSSLLFNDVSTHCSEDFSMRHGFYDTEITSDLHLINSCSSPEILKSNRLLAHEALNDIEMNIQENSLKTNNSFGVNDADSNLQEDLTQNPLTDLLAVHTHHPQPFSPSDIDAFELDIEYKKPFKLRESWQKEESLNAMTLEDLSEIE